MIRPPHEAVRHALTRAAHSPCAKSKRGVFIYYRDGDKVLFLGDGWNGPPPGHLCDGSAQCRSFCAQRCVHAEMRALRGVDRRYVHAIREAHPLAQRTSPYLIELVHVKAVNGDLVAGGGPSCVTCSREILDSGLIDLVWLYEERFDVTEEGKRLNDPSLWCSYDAPSFHNISLRSNGIY